MTQPNVITIGYPHGKPAEAIAITGEQTVEEILTKVKTVLEGN